MKQSPPARQALRRLMPPTRGHDLKLLFPGIPHRKQEMPPTRGHDLKLAVRGAVGGPVGCPPHGGTT